MHPPMASGPINQIVGVLNGLIRSLFLIRSIMTLNAMG